MSIIMKEELINHRSAVEDIRSRLKIKLFDKGSRKSTLEQSQTIQPTKGSQTPTNQQNEGTNQFISPKKNNESNGKSPSSTLSYSLKPKKQSSFDDEWICDRYVGEGGHAIVKRCFKRISQNGISEEQSQAKQKEKLYAVKMFRTGDPEIINTIRMTFNNNRMLMDSKHVIKAYDLYINERKQTAHLIMEYSDYPSLQKLLKYKKLNSIKVQRIMIELAQAVEAMHSKGVAHRDLKPDNILINLNGNEGEVDLKIIDFGVSKKFFQKTGNYNIFRDMWTRTGTIFYQAPEIFEGVGYDQQIDTWSIGIMLYQMSCGKLPYQCETIMDTIQLITEKTDCFEQDNSFRLLVPLQQDLIRRLLKKDPTKRLTAQDLKLHPWLKVYSSNNQIHLQQTQDDTYVKPSKVNHLLVDMAQSIQIECVQTSFKSNQKYRNDGIQEVEEDDEGNIQQWEQFNFTDHIHYVRKEETNFHNQYSLLKLKQKNSEHIGDSQEMNLSNKSKNKDSPLVQKNDQQFKIEIQNCLDEDLQIRRESLEFPIQQQNSNNNF